MAATINFKLFLKYSEQYKAYNNTPNRIYFYNSKNTPGLEYTDFDLNGLLREADMLRAIEMPAPAPAPPQKPVPPMQRQLPPPEYYDETNAYASFRFRYYQGPLTKKLTKTKTKTKKT